MTDVFKLELDKELYKGTVSLNTGLFINGQFVKPAEGGTIKYVLGLKSS